MYLLLSAAGGKDKDMYFNQVEFGKRLQECRKLSELAWSRKEKDNISAAAMCLEF